MDVRLITAPDDFLALRASWDDLHQRAALANVFMTHDWFDAAWQWRRESASLYILGCWSAGRLVGVLPLVRPTLPDALGSRSLEFLTVPDTQVCDVIVDADSLDEVASAFAAELSRRQSEWDVLRLRYLPPKSVAESALSKALLTRRMAAPSGAATGNLYVALDGPWDAYYGTRSRRVKKAVNLAANRLAKTGTVAVDWLTGDTVATVDEDALVAEIAGVSARSWKSVTGNSLDNPGPRAFIRKLTEHAIARGWLSVWILRVDGRPLAMEYQVVADGNVYALRSDFDAECEQISPGSYLSRHLLERLFDRGLGRYLMGPGGNPYKFRWAVGSEPVREVSVYGRSLRGRAVMLAECTLKPIARRVRERVRALRPAKPDTQVTDDGQD